MADKSNTIFGIYPVKEALSSGIIFDKVYIQKGLENDKMELIIKDLENQNVTINIVPLEKLYKLTKGNHQGIVAITSPIAFGTLESVLEGALAKDTPALFLILDQITDVRNFGAIIRTAECTNVDAVIIPKSGAASVSGDTVKASAGAIFKIPICKVDHIKDAIFYMKSSGIKIVAATEKSGSSVYDIDFTAPTAIILGSEGKGISRSVLNFVDKKAALPLLGEINSLNVSVACGVFLYEVVRQRSKVYIKN